MNERMKLLKNKHPAAALAASLTTVKHFNLLVNPSLPRGGGESRAKKMPLQHLLFQFVL